MAKQKTTDALDSVFKSCPFSTLSKFELENFQTQSGAGSARNLIEIVNRIRKIDSDLTASGIGEFDRCKLSEERDILDKYLRTMDPDQLTETIANWESSEREYWVNSLGKQAAIEILTVGRPSFETMSKMVRLPEDLYVKATQICVRLANAIRETTTSAEEQVGVVAKQPSPSMPSGSPEKVNKLIRKKR